MAEGPTSETHEPAGKHERPSDDESATAEVDLNQPVRDETEEQAPGWWTRVMLLGSGKWSRELTIAFQRLGAEVIGVERYPDAPAHRMADRSLAVTMTDTDELAAVIGRLQPNFVVTLTDAVSVDALRGAAETGNAEVVPSARGARFAADREGLRRLAADELGLPTAPFWFAGSLDELSAVAAHAGFPLVVTPVATAAGRGQSVVQSSDEVEPAWQHAVSAGRQGASNRVLAETAVEIDFRVTLLVVGTDGPKGRVIEFCAPIGHGELTDDGLESWQPQEMSTVALDAAKSIAARMVKALGGRGLFGVELMVRGDEVYFSDVTTRPYESGLVTLRTHRLSVFDLAARAILGMAVDTIMVSPGAARMVYADQATGNAADGTSRSAGAVAEALRVPESDVQVFGHHPSETSRRLGVALATAPEVKVARDRARQASTALRTLWQS